MINHTAIKICGITRVDDAKAAVENGASYIGLIFADQSPRKLDIEQAQAITSALNKKVSLVGVFKNNSAKEIRDVMAAVPLQLVQCHGEESPEFCKALGLPVIKTIEIDPNQTDVQSRIRRELDKYKDVQYILFDRAKESKDGTWLSKTVDVLTELSVDLKNYFLGGGLNPDNVKAVLSLKNLYAVDVASGVESSPGIKDHERLKLFCQNVATSAGTANRGKG